MEAADGPRSSICTLRPRKPDINIWIYTIFVCCNIPFDLVLPQRIPRYPMNTPFCLCWYCIISLDSELPIRISCMSCRIRRHVQVDTRSLSTLSRTALSVFRRSGVSSFLNSHYFAPHSVENKSISEATAQKMMRTSFWGLAIWRGSCLACGRTTGRDRSVGIGSKTFIVIGLKRCKTVISRF
jgi:hypothetical protein